MSAGVKTGNGTEFYQNGKPKYSGRYMNDTANDSDGTYFYENGNKMYNGSVVNGS